MNKLKKFRVTGNHPVLRHVYEYFQDVTEATICAQELMLLGYRDVTVEDKDCEEAKEPTKNYPTSKKNAELQLRLSIDVALLRKQKADLLALSDPQSLVFKEELVETAEGLINLIDYIQDEAAQQLGEEAVFS